jgi:hypothetical protein
LSSQKDIKGNHCEAAFYKLTKKKQKNNKIDVEWAQSFLAQKLENTKTGQYLLKNCCKLLLKIIPNFLDLLTAPLLKL